MMGVPGGEELPDVLLGKVEGLLEVVKKVRGVTGGSLTSC